VPGGKPGLPLPNPAPGKVVTPGPGQRLALEPIRVSAAKRDWPRVDRLVGQELNRPGVPPAVGGRLKEAQTAARQVLAAERLIPVLAAPAPDVPALEGQLDDLLTATGDKDLVGDVKEYLGLVAKRHGHPEEASKLLPPGREEKDPRALLRDLKKRLEAKYPETPGNGAAPPEVGPVPQPGVEGVKASVGEKPREGLPPLDEEADTLERDCRERLTVGLRQHADRPLPSLYLSLDRLRRQAHDGEAPEKDDAACEEEVARLLDRKLEPSERALVGVMRRQGKDPDEMADVLRRLAAESIKR
jgi:hypothetical protein